MPRPRKSITFEQLNSDEVIAYHEAGHAVMAILAEVPPFKYVTCDNKDLRALGIQDTAVGVVYTPSRKKLKKCATWRDYEKLLFATLMQAFAGPVAQAIFLGAREECIYPDGAESDLKQAFEIMRRVRRAQAGGMEVNDEQIIPYLHEVLTDVRTVLSREDVWCCVETVANALVKKKRLTYRQVINLLNRL